MEPTDNARHLQKGHKMPQESLHDSQLLLFFPPPFLLSTCLLSWWRFHALGDLSRLLRDGCSVYDSWMSVRVTQMSMRVEEQPHMHAMPYITSAKQS